MAQAAPPVVFPLRGFQLEGENPIGESAAQRVLAPFLRPDATLQTLQQATAALEAAFRAAGFGLHRVALPPQEVGQTVRLSIVKFALGKVQIEGRQIYDEENIRRTLPELRAGESPNFRRLAVQTAIANENPNKQVQVGLHESEEPDRIDATIAVREQRPWTLGLWASNAGSAATGRDRVTLTAGHTNLFNRDHQFIGAYTTSLQRTSDVRQLGLAYKVPLYAAGTVIGASYTRSDVVGNFGAFSSTGAGHTLGLSTTVYLPPQGARRSYVSLGLDDRVFDAARINDIVAPDALDRRSRPVSVGYTARTETDRSAYGYNVELAANTGAGAHNDLASYRSEDPRITTVHWKALRGGASYTAPLAQAWLWSARTVFQYSPDVLISGEQFGLGGLGSVRGTDIERPISGDKGISATVEVSTPELLAGLRLLGFLDAGYLWNNSPDAFARPASDRLASVGVGLRYAAGGFGASLDYGRLVQGSKVPPALNSNAPQDGDDRFYINLSYRF
ncbi:ShlB/FhaC/HecB family hemolysin secretion/activation protein [Ramlibacter alkalitolerans]|uniref:ShlB/FhaC/HecB family hemolysin secretion/activation protein n=1 Tax=Ramlibacter alkalitolerans TaxID=2039631 RepID=A0ABS1JQ01_9BURK|nr:ShlB/FhaC/HecB family hemolysin secretion/activation protein [Ramlibacter alkalitolerans]MBL0426353.1 ShlB/FhaC/HecB family hemolysin secretion/activation protein [Ramlibacter alkalitolerans]